MPLPPDPVPPRFSPLTAARLRRVPIPAPDPAADKEARGRVLLVGGSREVPGAALLAGTAALRVGAGKLQIAAPRSVAVALGVALPEGRIFSLDESAGGGVDPAAAEEVAGRAEEAEALLIGPGLMDPPAALRLTLEVLRRLASTPVVVDAGSLPALGERSDALHHLGGRVVVTPHVGEMATVLGVDAEEVAADPDAAALRAARTLRAVTVLKGPCTRVVAPGGEAFRYRGAQAGLATSGSGDVLAGVIAGLMARGASPLAAAAWGVHLHAAAGRALGARRGEVGFLARELADEIPGLLPHERRGRPGR